MRDTLDHNTWNKRGHKSFKPTNKHMMRFLIETPQKEKNPEGQTGSMSPAWVNPNKLTTNVGGEDTAEQKI
jgi:hypothetical protein